MKKIKWMDVEIKIKLLKKQINSKTLSDVVPCPHNKLKITNVVACRMSCRRFAGIESDFLLCGAIGANKHFHAIQERSHPSLWEIFGEEARDWMVGAYGKPKATKF